MTVQTRLPIEDTFGDVLRKGMRGHRLDTGALAEASGLPADQIDAWLADAALPSDAQARALARVLRLDPNKLAVRALDRWYPPAVERDDVKRHAQAPHPSNGYVLLRDDGRHAALIDPAGDPEHLLGVLREGGYELDYILITHKHDDHCDAVAPVAQAYPSARIVMHPLDVHAIGALAGRATAAEDGLELPFGKAKIRAIHTPGHTDGSVCYFYDGVLFTGDTLFAGSVGGAYGDDSTYSDILESIGFRLFSLQDETAVMPGHGPATTLGLEKAHNAFFPNEGHAAAR
jgi:glyoxylase-like metal-dependent hydrolase (beta-lactamase superfamily II)